MRRRGLDEADEALWAALSGTVTPLPHRPKPPELKRLKRKLPHVHLDEREVVFDGISALPYPALEPKQARRLARGQEEVERRLDLHGLTEAAAHRRLVTEVKRAIRDEIRLILVITGKGGLKLPQTMGTSAEFRTRDDFPGYTGVLRARFPVWLSGPDLAPYIVSYEPAQARHGGTGAWYVRLRKQRS